MKEPRVLWYSAIALFLTGMIFTVAQAAIPGTDASEHFSWGQVCVLCAVAMAWGDMRAQVKDMRREINEIKNRDD